MDTFIDKLAQKFTSNDMIKANVSAEAKENRKLREQVENYEKLLQDMRLVNMKNLESAQKITDILEKDTYKKDVDNREELEELFNRANENVHKENVLVYRNVQAVVNDGLKEQTDTIVSENAKEIKKQMSFLKVMSVLILVAVVADVAVNVLHFVGIL